MRVILLFEKEEIPFLVKTIHYDSCLGSLAKIIWPKIPMTLPVISDKIIK